MSFKKKIDNGKMSNLYESYYCNNYVYTINNY